MKISDHLLILLHITNGIEPYKIDYYLEYVALDYDKYDGIKYVLTDKGKDKMKIMIEKGIEL